MEFQPGLIDPLTRHATNLALSAWPAWDAFLALVPSTVSAWKNLPVEVKQRVDDLAASHAPRWRQPPT